MPKDDHHTANYYRNGGVKMMGGVVDGELPDDEDTLLTGDFTPAATFRAYIAGSRILQGGDLQLTVRVPYEDKYEAMPITDLRGITFVMVAFRPLRRDEIEQGEGNGDGGGGHDSRDTMVWESGTGGQDSSGTNAAIIRFPISDPFALSTDDG